MDRQNICCCGAQEWTRAIGFIQIIFAVIMLFNLGRLLIEFSKEGGSVEEVADIRILTLLAFVVVVITFSIIMNAILLHGSYKKNPLHINAWLIFNKISWVISCLTGLAGLFFTSGNEASGKFLFLVVGLMVGIFCIRVVDIHKKEIEATSGDEPSRTMGIQLPYTCIS